MVTLLTAFLLILTPFLFDPWLRLGTSNDRFYLIKDAFVLSLMTVLAALWLLRSLWHITPWEAVQRVGKWREKPPSLLTWEVCLLLFLLLATISACVNGDQFFSRLALVSITLGTLFYFVLSRSLSARCLRFLVLLQLHVSGFVGLHLFLQHLGYDPVLWLFGGDPGSLAGHAHGILGQPLVAGGYLAFGLPVGMAFLFSAVPSRLRVSLACTLAFALLGLVAAGNRSGVVSAAVGFMLVGLCASSEHRFKPQLTRRQLAFSFALLSLLGLLIWRAPLPLFSRLSNTLTLMWEGRWEAAAGSRPYHWQASLNMVADRPLLGQGLGSWMQKLVEYKVQHGPRPAIAVGELYFHAHNEFLQVWAEMGTPALLVVCIGVIALLAWGAQRIRGSREGGERMSRAEAMGLTASLATVFVVAMLSFPFHVSSTATPAILIAAALTGGWQEAKGLEQEESRARSSQLSALSPQPSVEGAVFFWSGKGYGWLAARLLLLGVVFSVSAFLLREITMPFRSSFIESRGDVVLLEAQKDYPPGMKERLYRDAEKWFRQALEIHPQNATALNSLGAALFGTKRYAEATQAFERTLEVLPAVEFYFNLGLAYYYNGEYGKAREVWEKGRKVKEMFGFSEGLEALKEQEREG